MKRWFKLVGFAQAEGEIIQGLHGLPLATLHDLQLFGDLGTVQKEWPQPLHALFVREMLPGGPSKVLYRVQGTIFMSAFKISTRFLLTPVSTSPQPWETVVHEWPT